MQHGLTTQARSGFTIRAERVHEVRTIARWLTWGSLIPVVGWVYGVGLLWWDEHFTTRQKVVGTLAFPGGWFGALVAFVILARETAGYCYTSSFGEQGGPELLAESGCVQTGALDPLLGLVLLGAVLASAALGPAYVRGKGMRQLQ